MAHHNDPSALALLEHAVDLCSSRLGYFDDNGQRYQPAEPWLAPDSHVKSKRAHLLSRMLGRECDGTHIPPEAEATVAIDGLTLVVRPGVVGETYTAFRGSRRRNSAKHRTFVVCPVCGRMVPMGRIAQHAPAHGPSPSRRW